MFTRPFVNSTVASGLWDREEPKLGLSPLDVSFPALSFTSAALASGAGQTADLPGPAEGYIRLYSSIHVTANSKAAGLTAVTISLRTGGTNYLIDAAITTTATGTSVHPPALGYGEVFRFTNGGNNAGRVCGTYVDIPATGITLVRVALDDTGVEVIPTAPTGYSLRFLQLCSPNANGVSGVDAMVTNLDGVTHSFETLVGSTVMSRTATVATTVCSDLGRPQLIPITASALKVKLTEAVDSVAPYFIGSYEAVPIVS